VVFLQHHLASMAEKVANLGGGGFLQFLQIQMEEEK
jgi:hypothetical protein